MNFTLKEIVIIGTLLIGLLAAFLAGWGVVRGIAFTLRVLRGQTSAVATLGQHYKCPSWRVIIRSLHKVKPLNLKLELPLVMRSQPRFGFEAGLSLVFASLASIIALFWNLGGIAAVESLPSILMVLLVLLFPFFGIGQGIILMFATETLRISESSVEFSAEWPLFSRVHWKLPISDYQGVKLFPWDEDASADPDSLLVLLHPDSRRSMPLVLIASDVTLTKETLAQHRKQVEEKALQTAALLRVPFLGWEETVTINNIWKGKR